MIKNDAWDMYDEDGIPAGDDHALEYLEDEEIEDEEYPVGYTPIQGNWSFDDYDNVNSFEKIGRRRERIRSVKTYTRAEYEKKKKQKIKQRSEAQAKEKKRQEYYHYGDSTPEE